MNPRTVFGFVIAFLFGFVGLLVFLVYGHTLPLLQPAGLVGSEERSLMISAVLLMLIIIIPVWTLAIVFAWWYRADNTTSKYDPEWENSILDEFVWWAIPFEIILVLGAITWTSTHTLDPYRALDVPGEPLTVQVVALEWKWLFIYPDEGIATVNDLVLPVGRPVAFQVTADAPMNSFWIPQLGGQIYAMTGMQTALHLIADRTGDFAGGSANFSGDGFAQMHFVTHAIPQGDFNAWVAGMKNASTTLDMAAYKTLAQPAATGTASYASVRIGLYNDIIMQFMTPANPHMRTPMHQ